MPIQFQKIGNYDLFRKIGSGGYGEVFLARKAGEKEFVAVKIIKCANAKREQDALEKYSNIIDKTNIVNIIEIGNTESEFYYVMPISDSLDSYCKFPPTDFRWQEKSLKKLIDRKQECLDADWFSREEILEFISPIFDAAISLGDNGFLHRDIKPDNILFFNGRPKLTDLGLLDNDRKSLSNMGTPLYIAPAWFLNKGGNPDIFGIAATFHTLITGNLPDTMGRPAYRIPEKIKNKISDNVREQYLHWHRCIMRAIAEAPADRYQTIADFKNAIFTTDFNSSRVYEQKAQTNKRSLLTSILVIPFLIIATYSIYFLTTQINRDNSYLPFSDSIYVQIKENGFANKGIIIESYKIWKLQKSIEYASLKMEYEEEKREAAQNATERANAIFESERKSDDNSRHGNTQAEIDMVLYGSNAERLKSKHDLLEKMKTELNDEISYRNYVESKYSE